MPPPTSGLNADHCALLVVLWSYLSLQKRTATESRETPGQAALFARDRVDVARKFVPTVRIETIAREFQDQFGSYSHVKSLIGTLRRLKFVGGVGDTVEPGPLLELAIEGLQPMQLQPVFFSSVSMACLVGTISNSTFRRAASSFTSSITGSEP